MLITIKTRSLLLQSDLEITVIRHGAEETLDSKATMKETQTSQLISKNGTDTLSNNIMLIIT
jgi:hypothetical protein